MDVISVSKNGGSWAARNLLLASSIALGTRPARPASSPGDPGCFPGASPGKHSHRAGNVRYGGRPRELTAEQRMSHYKSNRRDIEFNLFKLLDRQQRRGNATVAEGDEGV